MGKERKYGGFGGMGSARYIFIIISQEVSVYGSEQHSKWNVFTHLSLTFSISRTSANTHHISSQIQLGNIFMHFMSDVMVSVCVCVWQTRLSESEK